MSQITLRGTLFDSCESGSEGVTPAFQISNNNTSRGALITLQEGDILTIFADNNFVARKWHGLFDPKNSQWPPISPWFYEQMPAELTFSGEERISTHHGNLKSFKVPRMEAPEWHIDCRGAGTVLLSGDNLTIMDGSTELWSGVLQFKDDDLRMRYVFASSYGQTVTDNDIRLYLYPTNVPSELWGQSIELNRPAKLVRRRWERVPTQDPV